jgi:hypothetical protein
VRPRGDFHAWWDTPEWRAKTVEVTRLLPQYFPELAEEYGRKIVDTDTEDDGATVAYSLVFHPFLEHALHTEPDASPLLARIFAFLRMLEDHPDPHYSRVATVGIAEFLEDEPHLLRRAYPRLGPKMRAAVDKD